MLNKDNSKISPLVSIIIPCYNQAQYLPETIESLIYQIYKNWEAIIVNDGSSDPTSKVAKELIEKYSNCKIRLLEKENGGLARARNYGIEHANGDYILPLDADDKIDNKMLYKCVQVLEQNSHISIVYTDQQNFGVNNNRINAGNYDFKKLLDDNRLIYCSLYRKDIWIKVNGYNPSMKRGYEDWEFWIATGEKGFYGIRIPEPLFFYRVRESSMYTYALVHDLELRAQIVVNHPNLFSKNIVERGKKLINSMNSLVDSNNSLKCIFTKYLFGVCLAYYLGNVPKIIRTIWNGIFEMSRFVFHWK